MARQSVGRPKFYIDYIQYWHAKGMIHGFGPYAEGDNEETYPGGDYENGIDWLQATHVGGQLTILSSLDLTLQTICRFQEYQTLERWEVLHLTQLCIVDLH